MIKKLFGISIVLILLWGFGQSENFSKISAGIAIFLFGMIFLGQGFKEFTGGGFEKILKNFTDKTWKSITLGIFGATIMQSSSLVTIIAISFLSADLIPLAQGIAISLGSNIGTTTGAWLVAAFGMKISLSTYAYPILVFGFIFYIQKSKNLKGIGYILAGIGFVFLGVDNIKDGFETFRQSVNLMDYTVDGFKGILVFVLIGTIATIVLQSSLATIILVLAALGFNQVTYENAIALVIGANIGTTFTGILGSLNSNTNGKRLAVADVISKTLTGTIFTVFIYQVISLVDLIASGLNLTDPSMKIAIFHTIYNIVGVSILLPFYGKFVNFIENLLPETEVIQKGFVRNLYLNGAAEELPNTAIISLVKETRHMYSNSIDILLKILGLELTDLDPDKDGIVDYKSVKSKIKIYEGDSDQLYGEKIKILFGEIMDFSTRVQAKNPEKYFEEFSTIRRANINIVEAVKIIKHLKRNLERFLHSSNPAIKLQYEKIIEDLLFVIANIERLDVTEGDYERIEILGSMQKFISDNDIINNGKIDELIRNKLITNEMATSLIKDTNYKNDICKKLILVSEIVYNREIYNETEGKINISNVFGISSKKVEKLVDKFKKKKSNLKSKLKNEKDKAKRIALEKEIDKVEFIIEKYQDD
ncbi:Na/Pi cotransporter family protein [Candidatus Gracilibacteria bacterium]|nr:MAG: Na/Pi cotransporter family protein [Candidatus Gracilibacteria bacterium]